MLTPLDDTIAAISTPLGKGAIGIVRLSGPQALAIAESVFRPKRGALRRRKRQLCYGWAVDPESDELIDEVLAVFMPAPCTFTRQDVVEIHGHGGPYVLQRILAACLRSGARMARPGEMTLRAFVNGRIDLAQAEAIRDLVEARGEAARRQALAQLEGRLSARVRACRQRLLQCLAEVEASLDFPEDVELDQGRTIEQLGAALQELQALLRSAESGILTREGVRVAIVGRPNVGKSSLLNALLGEERAIVTPVPGTTRDTIEECVNISGVTFVLTDTAGLTEEPADLAETIGVERARAALARCHVALAVFDASEPLREQDAAVAQEVARAPRMLAVLNKCDLPVVTENPPLDSCPVIRVSAKTGAGIDALREALVQAAFSTDAEIGQEAAITSERQKMAVERALKSLAEGLELLRAGLPLDVVALCLQQTCQALGEITGETATEDILELVFSSFCLGK
jgi:tRNA modification GTPase